MSTSSDDNKTQLIEIAKAVGVILGVPLTLFAVVNSLIEQPVISLVVALLTAGLASIGAVRSQWANLTQVVIAWLALAVLVLTGFVIWPKTMVVSGLILDAAGRPVSQETVRLFDNSGKVYESKTDGEGYYRFAEVPSGQYRLQVRDLEVGGENRGFLVRETIQNLVVAGPASTSVTGLISGTPTVTSIPTNTLVPPANPPTNSPLAPTDTPVPSNTPRPPTSTPFSPPDTPTPTSSPVPPTATLEPVPVLAKPVVRIEDSLRDENGHLVANDSAPFHVGVRGTVAEATGLYLYLVVDNGRAEYIQPGLGQNIAGDFEGDCYLGLKDDPSSLHKPYKIFAVLTDKVYHEYDSLDQASVQATSNLIELWRTQ